MTVSRETLHSLGTPDELKTLRTGTSRQTARRLQPGMPAEVHIQTGERNVLSYVVKPLSGSDAPATSIVGAAKQSPARRFAR